MLSPKKSEAPNIPEGGQGCLGPRPAGHPCRLIRVISARMPPSPLLSTRITSITYFSVTMIVIDQKISEMTP
jgi:hypothetical protein